MISSKRTILFWSIPVKRECLLPPVVVYILQVEIVHQSVMLSDEIMFEYTAKRSICHCEEFDDPFDEAQARRGNRCPKFTVTLN